MSSLNDTPEEERKNRWTEEILRKRGDLIYEAENEEAETLMPISSKRME